MALSGCEECRENAVHLKVGGGRANVRCFTCEPKAASDCPPWFFKKRPPYWRPTRNTDDPLMSKPLSYRSRWGQ